MDKNKSARRSLIDSNGEVGELTDEDLSKFRPAMDLIPEIVEALERTRGQRGPQKAPIKERVGLRLNKDVIDYFRHTGPGWQSRINDILAEFVRASGK
jgi:uncharacterized protein (DUF4415 family)